MKSIFIRNFVAMASVVSLCFVLIAVAFVSLGRSYVIEEYRDKMELSANEAADITGAVAEAEGLDSWTVGMNISSIASSTGNHIFITDTEGLIMSCSDRVPRCEHIGVKVPEEMISGAQSPKRYYRAWDMDGFYPATRYIVGAPVTDRSGAFIGCVFVSADISSALSGWMNILRVAAYICACAFGLAIVVSLIYSKKMAKPLDDMADAARRYAKGDFSIRVKQEDDTDDEMGTLIEAFNSMADSLENAEKRRTEFISNVSHELRTPMTTISGFAEGILDGTIPPEEEEKYLVSIRDETKRLSRLVRDMLDASRIKSKASGADKQETFDLTELILRTMLSFEDRASKKQLDVDPQLPDNHIMVVGYPDAITRVIFNLIDNAVKFSYPGTCITIRLYKDDTKAFVSVKDEGETIPPEDLPFVFDRFHKSDKSRSRDKEGVGLGLYLVKEIINSHDENIAVKSENGMTEFTFTLKLA